MKGILKYFIVFVTIAISVIAISFLILESISEEEDLYTLELKKYNESEWYYEVYSDSKLIIKQETIPGVTGIQRFKSKEEAKKIGTLVITKMKSGIMPMISLNELKEYDITFKK